MSAFEERAAAGPPWSSDGWKYFEEACDIIVRKCGVLQLAVDQEWGGRNSKQKLDSAIDDFLSNCRKIWDLRTALEQATAEVYWEEVIEDDFNCDLEGDTTQATSLALQLESLYDECSRGVFGPSLALMVEAEAAAPRLVAASDEPAPVVADADGWVTVVKKGAKGKGKGAAPVAAAAGAGLSDSDDESSDSDDA